MCLCNLDGCLLIPFPIHACRFLLSVVRRVAVYSVSSGCTFARPQQILSRTYHLAIRCDLPAEFRCFAGAYSFSSRNVRFQHIWYRSPYFLFWERSRLVAAQTCKVGEKISLCKTPGLARPCHRPNRGATCAVMQTAVMSSPGAAENLPVEDILNLS